MAKLAIRKLLGDTESEETGVMAAGRDSHTRRRPCGWSQNPRASGLLHGARGTALPRLTSVIILYIVLPASLFLMHSFLGNPNLFNEAAVLFWSPVLGLSHFFRSRFTLLGCFISLMFKGILQKSSSLTRRCWWHFFFFFASHSHKVTVDSARLIVTHLVLWAVPPGLIWCHERVLTYSGVQIQGSFRGPKTLSVLPVWLLR